jgi:lipopolysaccharide biosynthesis protein
MQRTVKPSSKLAVIIHLFYEDNWLLFETRLGNIEKDYDLFVSIPESKPYLRDMVKKSFPAANCIAVPNKGRDVLPFTRIASCLEDLGYEYILKFHSKKSTHWDGGQDWLEGMMERLLPSTTEVIKATIDTLRNNDTGIVGPSDVYYPLTINFPANRAHMTRIIDKLFGREKSHEVLQDCRKKYGFFGGTMFWARLDAISPLLHCSVYDFETESGQIDGTYAHALERLFCIIPEIEQKRMFELTPTEMHARNYTSDNIPDWSQDHDK